MDRSVQSSPHPAQARGSFLYDPKVRGAAYQILLVAFIAFLFYEAATNAIENLRRARIASGFGFWNVVAGFDVSQSLIPFSAAGSTYGQAFLVGLLNTLLVSALGIVLATILGFVMGVARLSKNWIVEKLATAYVELIRNVPLLLQLFFWYYAVIGSLPQPRESVQFGAGFFLNTRGLFMPRPLFAGDAWVMLAAFTVGLIGAIAFRIWAKRRQEQTGRQYPVGWTALGLIVGLPALVWIGLALAGANPIAFD